MSSSKNKVRSDATPSFSDSSSLPPTTSTSLAPRTKKKGVFMENCNVENMNSVKGDATLHKQEKRYKKGAQQTSISAKDSKFKNTKVGIGNMNESMEFNGAGLQGCLSPEKVVSMVLATDINEEELKILLQHKFKLLDLAMAFSVDNKAHIASYKKAMLTASHTSCKN